MVKEKNLQKVKSLNWTPHSKKLTKLFFLGKIVWLTLGNKIFGGYTIYT